MHIPPVYPAVAIFDGDDLNGMQKCLCNQQVTLRDVSVVWTHPVSKDDYGWFCVCSRECYTRNVCASHDN